ncbi:MAG: MmcQ/YjbR family DNA-binding protein [Candidatus Eremiobacteraeota bacterium]|nr:MmcQ/YjbR family DNA-binding protein [Candidatus Eremiobacteraeota bacterium]MBC5826593.1 MmcQ/YjbR family DNA-binding protein [Candidatus Eremiobacteraeota bacterium]
MKSQDAHRRSAPGSTHQDCLALPEATRRISGLHAGFLVRNKHFAYYLNDHHGDGVVSCACKALPGDNEALVARDGIRLYLPAYIGPRGWVAMRLDLAKINWSTVANLVAVSYQLVA